MVKSFVLLLTVTITLGAASTAAADPPQALGGLDLMGYCRAQGFDTVIFPRGRTTHHAAVQNWACANADGTSLPVNGKKACEWQYGLKAVQERFTDVHDAYTWVCYSVRSD